MRFFLGEYKMDTDRREFLRGDEAVHVEPQVFDLILHLVQNRDRVVSKDDLIANVWDGRIISESTLSNRINAARRALGDSGERQEFIKTIPRRGWRFVGEVSEEEFASTMREPGPPSPTSTSAVQETTFCRAPDGTKLAVASSGSGFPVVKASTWLSHIEFDWQSPMWSPLLNLLSGKFRLIRYDERGNGLSDWDVENISFEAFVQDLETVVDTLGLKRFALFGFSQGAAVSIAYAVRHPDRVSRLVLSGGYAQGWRKRAKGDQIAQFEALATLVRNSWGRDNPAFRHIFTSLYMPDATNEEMQWVNDLQRVSASAENTIRLMRALGEVDLVDALPHVKAPTLVLHSRGDTPVPFEQGLMLARGIPNARFVNLESKNHLIISREAAWTRYTQEICGFLSEGGDG